MIEAVLMVGERLVGIINLDHPLPGIKYNISFAISSPVMSEAYYGDYGGPTATMDYPQHQVMRQEIIFRFARQIGYGVFEYQYEQVMSQGVKYHIHEHTIPIEQEPDENVNLDKLKLRMKDNVKVREMLLTYYSKE